MIRTINAEGRLEDINKKDFILLMQDSKILWASNISQKEYPLRPIVSSRDAITYYVTKELGNIIRPLIEHSPHHIRNTQDFVDQLKSIIIRHKLEWDVQLHLRTFLKNLHASTAHNNTINTIVTNLFMKEFETKTINTKLWLRYVDGTFLIQKEEHNIQFLQHINSIYPLIQFTLASPNTDGSIPFWVT